MGVAKLRTSRVSMATSSTYRRAKRYLDTNEAFTLMQDDGALAYFNEKQKQNKKKKPVVKKQVLVQTNQHILIKGILFEVDTVAVMRNQLLHQSISVNSVSNLKRRNYTYRTSI